MKTATIMSAKGCIVDQRERIGYADESGRAVIKPRFAFGFPFENGKAKVTDEAATGLLPIYQWQRAQHVSI